jgi:hypothetical protein
VFSRAAEGAIARFARSKNCWTKGGGSLAARYFEGEGTPKSV